MCVCYGTIVQRRAQRIEPLRFYKSTSLRLLGQSLNHSGNAFRFHWSVWHSGNQTQAAPGHTNQPTMCSNELELLRKRAQSNQLAYRVVPDVAQVLECSEVHAHSSERASASEGPRFNSWRLVFRFESCQLRGGAKRGKTQRATEGLEPASPRAGQSWRNKQGAQRHR